MEASRADSLPFASDATGVRLAIRVTPRAQRDAIDGVVRDAGDRAALQVRLAALPVGGAANKALIAFLAKALGVSRTAIEIRSGATSRLKVLHVAGPPEDIAARLLAVSGGAS